MMKNPLAAEIIKLVHSTPLDVVRMSHFPFLWRIVGKTSSSPKEAERLIGDMVAFLNGDVDGQRSIRILKALLKRSGLTRQKFFISFGVSHDAVDSSGKLWREALFKILEESFALLGPLKK